MARQDKVTMAFEPEGIRIALTDILPVKQLATSTKTGCKYKQIAASIREIGLIEPLVVTRQKGHRGAYLLLDGHVRLQILKDFGAQDTMCLIATDDEAFTYNKRISRLATIQEHKMILKAIESGVPEERIAKALDINVALIRRKRRLLDGICPEVADLLKDRHCPIDTFRSLKQLKPIRQMEVAQLMVTMNNYSVPYSKALLAATPVDQLVDAKKPKIAKGVSPEQMARMEAEMDGLQREMKQVGASPDFDATPTPVRGVNPATLREIISAIRHKEAIKVKYQSLSQPEPKWRWIAPHAIAFDGFRWHARAWCEESKSFKDFLLSRMLENGEHRQSNSDATSDADWNAYVTLEIGPHPELSPTQKDVIALDYGMHDGKAEIKTRKALLYYTLKRLGLDTDPSARAPQDQQIILLNREAVLGGRQTGHIL